MVIPGKTPNVTFCLDDVQPERTQEIIDNVTRIYANFYRKKAMEEQEQQQEKSKDN